MLGDVRRAVVLIHLILLRLLIYMGVSVSLATLLCGVLFSCVWWCMLVVVRVCFIYCGYIVH